MKLKRKYNNIPIRYIIISIIILVVVLLIIFSYTLNNNKNNKVVSIIKDASSSIVNIISYPFKLVINSINDINKLDDVLYENDILSDSVDKIDYLTSENLELKRQLDSLKEELSITNTLTDYDKINATVISRNIGYWYNNITINKGSDDGIEINMAVINSSGLIGRVYSTTSNSSVIKLITTSDTNNKISVVISHGEEYIYGLVNKYNYKSNVLEVEGVSNTLDVEIGDYVYTSGLGGVYPSGILIGKVSSITTDSYDLAKIINIKTEADFTDINYVAVLRRK